jgi:integration host factor subunit alpha
MTLTKARLVDSLFNKTDISMQEAAAIVESVLEIIKQTLASGEDVMISGFGKFIVKEKKKRRGRNPATGDDLILDARRIVTFKCSNLMRDRLNGKG